MRQISLARSTPFRLALAFALLFVCAFLFSGLVTYKLIERELDQRYDARTQELFRVISQTYDQSDVQDLIDATRVHIAATPGRRDIFILQSADGHVLAGNVPAVQAIDGWSKRPAADFGISNQYTYRLFSGMVGDNRLTVGTNNEETGDLRRIVIASFGWAMMVVVALATGGGILIASRAQRRLDAVRDTMARVSHGDLAARVPLLGKGDDLDRLSSDINEALDRLAVAVEGIRQVSTDIAHDLKTPLNRLRIDLEEMQLKLDQGRAGEVDVQAALDEVGQINQTCEAILRIAQIESGARKSRFSSVNLAAIFDNLAAVYTGVAEDAGDVLWREVDPKGSYLVYGDAELLTQMYANLIENAIRHCPPGALIRLRIDTQHEQIITVVQDDGPGIPPDEHERVFQRLYRLEKSRTSPGTGLGLSLVKAIADLHSCHVELTNARPGLRIRVTFPVQEFPSPST